MEENRTCETCIHGKKREGSWKWNHRTAIFAISTLSRQ